MVKIIFVRINSRNMLVFVKKVFFVVVNVIMLNINVFINVDNVFCDILLVISKLIDCGVDEWLVEVYVFIIVFVEKVVMINMFEVIIDSKVFIDVWFIMGKCLVMGSLFVIFVVNMVVMDNM